MSSLKTKKQNKTKQLLHPQPRKSKKRRKEKRRQHLGKGKKKE